MEKTMSDRKDFLYKKKIFFLIKLTIFFVI